MNRRQSGGESYEDLRDQAVSRSVKGLVASYALRVAGVSFTAFGEYVAERNGLSAAGMAGVAATGAMVSMRGTELGIERWAAQARFKDITRDKALGALNKGAVLLGTLVSHFGAAYYGLGTALSEQPHNWETAAVTGFGFVMMTIGGAVAETNIRGAGRSMRDEVLPEMHQFYLHTDRQLPPPESNGESL